MKKMKVSLLALTALVGGTMLASAEAAPQAGATYVERIEFATAPAVITVSSFSFGGGNDFLTPDKSTGFTLLSSSIDTDGSGKIEGVAVIRLLNIATLVTTNGFTTNTDGTNITIDPILETNTSAAAGFSDFAADVSGKISTKKDAPSITLTIKGSGYSGADTNIDFFNVSLAAKPASMNLKFVSSSGVSNETIGGKLTGTVNPGIKAINNGKAVKINETATLNVNSNAITDFLLHVVQIGTKINATTIDEGDLIASGKGSVNSKGAFTVNFKGVSFSRGSSFKLTGTTGPLDISITDTATNSVPNAPITGVELKGKIDGQTVDATGGTGTLIGF